MRNKKFPSLLLSEWKETRDTLHKYCKMVGAIRENFSKPQPHWQHLSLRVDGNELTTLPLQKSAKEKDKTFEVKLNLINRKLLIVSSYRETMSVSLTGQSLSALCDETCSLLSDIGINPKLERPGFIDGKTGKFEQKWLKNYWIVLKGVNNIFEKFKSRLKGQTSPVQLWPHHFDLAVSWFSGRLIPGKDPKNSEESQEQMTFGFSAGDETITDAYFYATAYPIPEDLLKISLPGNAYWNQTGFRGAVLRYDSLVENEKPTNLLLNFLRTIQLAGEKLMIGTAR